jgi:uncharacterized protein (DUF736 family)
MAIIGKFTLSNGKFSGKIETLTLKAALVFIPENATGENAPTHRIYSGKAEVGAAWRKTAAKTGMDYLSVKLDDMSFEAPIYASLYPDDKAAAESMAFNLVWNRPNSKD